MQSNITSERMLRFWQSRAKNAFNALWVPVSDDMPTREERRGVRAKAYKWLANQLCMDTSNLHFNQITLDECQRIFAICSTTPLDFFRREA